MRILVLVDGEHYPPVVRSAIEQLPQLVPSSTVVAAALLGGTEKLRGPGAPDYGVPLITGESPEATLRAALAGGAVDLVFDLCDEPVVDSRTRMYLAAVALHAGVPYRGADFTFTPPPRPIVATKPAVAIVGTGKRTGKTAVSAHVSRILRGEGRAPVVVAMGRGGPDEPEVVDPAAFDLSPAGLVALADAGRHAASDHLEDALVAGVRTIGTLRCGGGLAGAPASSTFAAGVAIANDGPEPLMLLEGSGSSLPPVHADATIAVVPAHADIGMVTGYLGAYRLLLADLVVVTMAETDGVDSAPLEAAIREIVARAGRSPRIVRTVFRPFPLEPIAGRRVFYATTAPASALDRLSDHLETDHGATVVGRSANLAHRAQLAADLDGVDADTLVVELKAAAVDVAARAALERGMHVVVCDNRSVTVGGDGDFETLAGATVDLAVDRFAGRGAAR